MSDTPGDGGSAAERQLRGTPYLIQGDEPTLARFALAQQRSLRVRDEAERAERRIRETAAALLAPFQLAIRTHLVSESNRIEGYEWSSKMVREVVQTHQELLSLPLHNFLNALRSEPRVFEALGLYRAHQLADEWGARGERPREYEIRSLHALIAAGEEYSGSYKGQLNAIAGSAHRPTDPWDVPRAMEQLTAWWRTSTNDPVLDAAVVHAWLTHIHPFVDGNGRMARVLANLTLVQAAYPPLILRSDSDRGQYYDALAQSDVGDILPLYELFSQVIRRTVRVMARSDYVREIVEDRLLTSVETTHALWLKAVERFVELVARALDRQHWSAEVMGYRDLTAFGLLLDRDSEGNGWFLRIRDDERSQRWLLWFGYASETLLLLEPTKVSYPSIFFSIRNTDRNALHPYLWTAGNGIPDEVTIRPLKQNPVLVRDGTLVEEFSLEGGARAITARLLAH
jgi:Fic family protein